MNRRFLIVILGTASDIDKDLNFIADSETGVNFVDGKGIFICTFYSPYTAAEIHEKLVHRPAIMIFDITDSENYGVNLPSKYYMGLFPEVAQTIDSIKEELRPMGSLDTFKNDVKKVSQNKKKQVEYVEEYDSVDEILDKLSRNNYDRGCLTNKEKEILNKG